MSNTNSIPEVTFLFLILAYPILKSGKEVYDFNTNSFEDERMMNF